VTLREDGAVSGKSAKAKRRSEGAAGGTPAELDAVMVRDDVSWVVSLVTAANESAWDFAVGLSVIPQVARVLHEGLAQLQRRRPEAVPELTRGWDPDIATARHTVKLLDDTKKTIDSVLEEFASIGAAQSAAFSSRGDFAFVESDGRALATSRLASYQGIASLDDRGMPQEGTRSYNVGQTMGGRIVALQRAFGKGDPVVRRVSLPFLPTPRPVELTAEVFDAISFDASLPMSAKDVVMIVECAVNAALHVFAPTDATHPATLFRVRFVAVTHAVSALRQIVEQFPENRSASARRRLEAILDSPSARRLVALRPLRNRSMHYGIPATMQGLTASLPAYGLVEATTQNEVTHAEINSEMVSVLESLSDALRDWRHG
jgi:hypothetical protein